MNINYVDTEIPEMAQFHSSGRQRLYVTAVRGATQNFWEFEYTAQTVSATNLRR